MIEPPAFCTGSAMISATSSGSGVEDRLLDLGQQPGAEGLGVVRRPGRGTGSWCETWLTSIGGGPKSFLKPGTPVRASAPRVTPW